MRSSGLFPGFRLRLIPSLIAVPAFATLLALGIWQMQRHVEKAEINQFRAVRASAPAVDPPAASANLSEFEFRRIRVTGRFAHDRELFVYGRSQRGNDGYYIITPLIRDTEPALLVNRGWVPKDRKEPDRRAAGQVEGTVSVTGFLRRDARRGWLMPDNEPQRNHWFWFDLPEMFLAARLDRAEPYYVEADASQNPGGFPIGAQTQLSLPDPHLNYAFTWFALAAALAVIYIAWHRRGGA
jgi:surfeit locus 1 family protein